MLKLLAWIWAAVTEDRANSRTVVSAQAEAVRRIVVIEQKIEAIEQAGNSSRPHHPKVTRASDLKAAGSMKVFNSDRGEYKAWHAKLVNVMAQLSSNARKIMESVRATLDEDPKYDLVSLQQVIDLTTVKSKVMWR